MIFIIKEVQRMNTADKFLQETIQDNLNSDTRIFGSQIHVSVNDGIVTLTGTAHTYGARRAAETDVWIFPRVTKVNNLIKVMYNR
jgi:osmotically-inducible protein OsmY